MSHGLVFMITVLFLRLIAVTHDSHYVFARLRSIPNLAARLHKVQTYTYIMRCRGE